MANKTLFQTIFGGLIPAADAINAKQAPAYVLSPWQALAQYAATGCFSRTFYASADEQLKRVLELCEAVGPEFVAQVAVYSRRNAFIKDMPPLLCAWLAVRAHEGDLGIIPGSMGARSYIVRGKGNPESFHSCSHGAGRAMSRNEPRKNSL